MIPKKYPDIYRNIDFERIELFQAINDRCHPETVLYPGSSLHITPSFVFQNVTYVDPAHIASEFFLAMDQIQDFIAGEAQYRQRPCIRYLQSSVEECSDLSNESLDLIFSSFSGI